MNFSDHDCKTKSKIIENIWYIVFKWFLCSLISDSAIVNLSAKQLQKNYIQLMLKSRDYWRIKSFFTISSKLKDVELKRKDERLIENVSKIVFFENKYVLSLNIRSISLFNKKIITSLRKSLINIFNTFTSFFQIARFISSKFVQFVVFFS